MEIHADPDPQYCNNMWKSQRLYKIFPFERTCIYKIWAINIFKFYVEGETDMGKRDQREEGVEIIT